MFVKKRLVYLLPLAALGAGFANAWLAAGVHSTFFALLPALAFVLGYFSSWRTGLICGFLLFLSYTVTTALMWEVRYAFFGISQYIGAFIFGGFSIPLIGGLAALARRGIKHPQTILAVSVTAAMIAACGYYSVPRYRYSYGFNIICEQDMELYLPAAQASGRLPAELLNGSVTRTGSYPPDWSNLELVDTEYGKMWHFNMESYAGVTTGQIERSSNLYMGSDEIRSWPGISPVRAVRLSPRLDVSALNRERLDNLSWPAAITRTMILEGFKVPVKVITETPAGFELDMYCNTASISYINFGYYKDESYSEQIEWVNGTTDDSWTMVPAISLRAVSIRGIGD
jgi:hypothetical protein